MGLIAPWMPRPAARPNTASTVRGGSSGQKNRAKGGNAGGKKEEGVKIVIEAKGMDEIRKAITVGDNISWYHTIRLHFSPIFSKKFD